MKRCSLQLLLRSSRIGAVSMRRCMANRKCDNWRVVGKPKDRQIKRRRFTQPSDSPPNNDRWHRPQHATQSKQRGIRKCWSLCTDVKGWNARCQLWERASQMLESTNKLYECCNYNWNCKFKICFDKIQIWSCQPRHLRKDSRFVIFYFMNRIQAKMQIELKYSLSAILSTQLNKTLYTSLF